MHCKSDITHKLNRNEARAVDILHTLHDSMASKVIALLEKGQCELRRVLLIGGVTRNAAMLAALREKRPGTQFVVTPESPWFEAWGSALLTRDEPLYKSPHISSPASSSRLPALRRYDEQVQVLTAPLRQPPPNGPMVLGVDAGSTTTKAILLDAATSGVVASHYTRTKGDPVAATRECLRALVEQIGNRRVGLVGTTGSARELAGAYLGTAHVYNEISAQAAGAGVQTRLEAFLDIVRNYRREATSRTSAFAACRLDSAGLVLRSNGERVALADPRVRLYFLNFSQYHTEAFGLAARWLGLHPGKFMPLERSQLDKGLQYTSGRECLPLPICIGQLLQIHENRQADEIIGFYMLQGGAPCVVDAYMGYFERFIGEQRLPDVFLFNPQEANGYLGFDPAVLAQHISPAIVLADIMVEVENVLQVVGEPGAVDQLRSAWVRYISLNHTFDEFQRELPTFIDRLAQLPRRQDPLSCPRVVVVGDFFTRFSSFFMDGVRAQYAKHGIILKPVDLNELSLYMTYDALAGTASRWDMTPGAMALAKACSRYFHPEGKEYIQQWLGLQKLQRLEAHYRGLFQKTGLLIAGANVIAAIFAKGAEHISPAIFGEILPTLGRGIEAAHEGYHGIIVIGPFNCLPFRISEAILKPLSIQRGMPILTYESDGYAVSPSFLRQVEVHTQQVLDHHAQPPAQGGS